MNLPMIDDNHLEEVIRHAIARLESNAGLTGIRITPRGRVGLLRASTGSGETSAAIDFLGNGSSDVLSGRLWMKTAKDPDKAFQVISSAYKRLVGAGLRDTAPRPVAPDVKNGVVITEYVAGKPLLNSAYAFCLRGVPKPDVDMEGLFKNLGCWLALYHESAYAGSETTMSDLIVQIDRDMSHSSQINQKQLSVLRAHLASAKVRKCADRQFHNVHSHTDFALRNILFRSQDEFTVTDWDAPLERKFPEIGICWWDLYHMWININSLIRLWPLISRHRIRMLAEWLVNGYLENCDAEITYEDFKHCICYPLSLQYLAGSQSIRRVDLRYKNLLARRFLKLFRNAAVDGNADIVSGFPGI